MKEPSYIHPFNGTFEFTNLGRQKACFTKKLHDEKDFWRAVVPHYASRDLEYDYDAEKMRGVIFAGFHMVGFFKRVGP